MAATPDHRPAPRNRTLTLTAEEHDRWAQELLRPPLPGDLTDKIICADTLATLADLPRAFADLLFLDPPYNLAKTFGAETFREQSLVDYEAWFESWFVLLLPALKPTASLYICGDWRSSAALHRVLDRHVIVRNRITWERDKGRGAKANWKNASEDIWFATVSDEYTFHTEAVKLRRRVLATYRDQGEPKDWEKTEAGTFRLTHPSNLWTDLTVPFWSMPENTEHPTQKPEKLLGKLLLASTRAGDLVLDPFLGSGTTAVVARKLGRRFLGIERDESFGCFALKRLATADTDSSIQGYEDGVFWERNARRR